MCSPDTPAPRARVGIDDHDEQSAGTPVTVKIARNLRTGSFGLNKSTSVGNPTPQSFWVVRSWRQAGDTRRLRGRVTVQSACPSASYSPRSCVPQPPGGKARENAHHTRRGLCTFSRSVSDSVFRSICIVCLFFLLHRVTICPIYQHASFWHIRATPTLLLFCRTQTNLYRLDVSVSFLRSGKITREKILTF